MRTAIWIAVMAVLPACGDDDSGGGGGGPDAAVPANNGFIAVSSYSAMANGTAVVGGSASATFAAPGSTTCTQTTIGECIVTHCPQTTPSITYLSDGTVTIGGAAIPITMMPKTDKSYMPVTSNTQALFSGGEHLTFSTTGGDAPAFMATVTAPSRATITSPAKPAGTAALAIDRAADFHATWSGGGSGKVYLYISGPTGSGMIASCGFAASAGSGSIPASVLGMVPAGMGAFSSSSIALEMKDVGDWRIYAQAFFTNVWADMSMASATATLN